MGQKKNGAYKSDSAVKSGVVKSGKIDIMKPYKVLRLHGC